MLAVTGKNSYKAYVAQQRELGNWFCLPRKSVQALGCLRSVFITYLLNAGQTAQDGWIWCTASYIEEGIGINSTRQKSVIAWFQSRGILKVDRTPAGRKIKIDVSMLSSYIQSHC